MIHSYGPWTSAMQGGKGRLSTFWRRRLDRLPVAARTRPALSPPQRAGFVVFLAALAALPTLHGWAVPLEPPMSLPPITRTAPPASSSSVPARWVNEPVQKRIYSVEIALARIEKQQAIDEQAAKAWLEKHLKMCSPQVGIQPLPDEVLLIEPTGDAIGDTRWLSAKHREEYLREVLGAALQQDRRPIPPRLQWRGHQLEVEATASLHRCIAAALDDLAYRGKYQLKIETRFVTGPSAQLAGSGLRWAWLASAFPSAAPSDDYAGAPSISSGPAPDGKQPLRGIPRNRARITIEKNMPLRFAYLDPAKARDTVDSWNVHPKVRLLQAPRLTLWPGQSAFVSDTSLSPFVVGVHGDRERPLLIPQIRAVREGVMLQLQPTLLANHDVKLWFNIVSSKVRSVETLDLVTEAGKQATVQVPEVVRASLEGEIEVPLKQSLLLWGVESQEPSGKDLRTVVMLRFDLAEDTSLSSRE